MQIHFDPELHEYHLDGRPVPGIHKIAETLHLIDAPRDEQALLRGKYIHEAIELHLKGRLDPMSCGWAMMYVAAADAALMDLGIEITDPENQVECLVANAGLGYATQIDAVGTVLRPITPDEIDADGSGMSRVPVAINWKSGEPWPFHALQSAAEVLCLPGAGWLRLSIHLKADGTSYPKWHKDERDFDLWRYACDLYDWKCRTSGRSARPRRKAPPAEATPTVPVQDSTLFEVEGS